MDVLGPCFWKDLVVDGMGWLLELDPCNLVL